MNTQPTHSAIPGQSTGRAMHLRGFAALAALVSALFLLATPAQAQGSGTGTGTVLPGAQPGPTTSGDTPAPEADAEVKDIDALRKEYLRLRDELFRSRARAATVAGALYSTRLQVNLRYDSARFYSVTRATIRLDGANVYDDTSGAIAQDNALR